MNIALSSTPWHRRPVSLTCVPAAGELPCPRGEPIRTGEWEGLQSSGKGLGIEGTDEAGDSPSLDLKDENVKQYYILKLNW